jgi:hypothetical protein
MGWNYLEKRFPSAIESAMSEPTVIECPIIAVVYLLIVNDAARTENVQVVTLAD